MRGVSLVKTTMEFGSHGGRIGTGNLEQPFPIGLWWDAGWDLAALRDQQWGRVLSASHEGLHAGAEKWPQRSVWLWKKLTLEQFITGKIIATEEIYIGGRSQWRAVSCGRGNTLQQKRAVVSFSPMEEEAPETTWNNWLQSRFPAPYPCCRWELENWKQSWVHYQRRSGRRCI